MKKHIVYKTEGVCASKIEFDLEDGRVYHVQFHGGCKGMSRGSPDWPMDGLQRN